MESVESAEVYARRLGIQQLLEAMALQVLSHRPAKPIPYLACLLESMHHESARLEGTDYEGLIQKYCLNRKPLVVVNDETLQRAEALTSRFEALTTTFSTPFSAAAASVAIDEEILRRAEKVTRRLEALPLSGSDVYATPAASRLVLNDEILRRAENVTQRLELLDITPTTLVGSSPPETAEENPVSSVLQTKGKGKGKVTQGPPPPPPPTNAAMMPTPRPVAKSKSVEAPPPPPEFSMQGAAGVELGSGRQLVKEVLQDGAGDFPMKGDRVELAYTGTLVHGSKEFDSSSAEEPFSFVIGDDAVLPGWNLAVLSMRPKERCGLTIHPALAYGEKGMSNVIPPNAVLHFVMELVAVHKAENLPSSASDQKK